MSKAFDEIKPGYVFKYQPHWFPHYVDDWITSTDIMAMTPSEYKTYHMLLHFQWKDPRCVLDLDIKKLKANPYLITKCVIKTGSDSSPVFDKFVKTDSIFYNKKLWNLRKESEIISLKRARNGKQGGRPSKKEKSNSFTNALQMESNSKAFVKPVTVTVTDTVTDTNNVTVNVSDLTGFSNGEIADMCLSLEPEMNQTSDQHQFWLRRVNFWDSRNRISEFMDKLHNVSQSGADNKAAILVKQTKEL